MFGYHPHGMSATYTSLLLLTRLIIILRNNWNVSSYSRMSLNFFLLIIALFSSSLLSRPIHERNLARTYQGRTSDVRHRGDGVLARVPGDNAAPPHAGVELPRADI